MKTDLGQLSLLLHKKYRGKLEIKTKIPIKDKEDLSLVYTPGVASVSRLLAISPKETNTYTSRGNTVAVISDGSAVLGLGNIGPYGALPVMEGKCALFKHFAGIDAIPIVLATQDPDEIIKTVLAIAPGFGGINLEDIKAPGCFQIENELQKKLDIPVIHDDQWGAAVVTLAALINALRLVKKKIESVKITVSGAGAAGSAIVKILLMHGAKNILVCDRAGIIYRKRPGNSHHKSELANTTNPTNKKGALMDALVGCDVFIGVSSPDLLTPHMVKSMNTRSIVFALANPTPEIMPEVAKKSGAYIVATGRSDFPNQVNNALAFPGIFRGALDRRVRKITLPMLINVSKRLAAQIPNPTPEKIIPSIFDKGVVAAVSEAITA